MSEKSKEKLVCRIGQISQLLVGLTVATAKTDMNLTITDRKGLEELQFCIEDKCAHWRQLYSQTIREDHSGGKELIFKFGVETNRSPRREGPGGSTGIWILDASGYCGLAGKP